MLVITGDDALSDFRQKKLLQSIQRTYPKCQSIRSQFLYFVDVDETWGNDEDRKSTDKLIQLLEGRGAYEELISTDDTASTGDGSSSTLLTLFCVPRLGTISPWSTKATDIVHRCGLDKVNRVERGIRWQVELLGDAESISLSHFSGLLYDPMIETALGELASAEALFKRESPKPLNTIDLLGGGLTALAAADKEFGFALSGEEQAYLVEQFTLLGRNPTDVELMMFAQVNSEHCRHKIFNADWSIDQQPRSSSLFSMIRTTHQRNSQGTLTAYNDNAAVIEGANASRFSPDPIDRTYRFNDEPVHFTIKVETHNHPTAISPFPGASTGSGGEIRDEGATGRGGKPKAGLVGYAVSHLRLPQMPESWESVESKPERIATPLQIMLEAPIGAAAFNNEFGRPAITGYFRSFEHPLSQEDETNRYGYHKPIMLAGGLGNIREQHIKKQNIANGALIVVLGGPTMLIGLGGGAASSVASGESAELLDFASVQRGNPEMQRRCQEVIDACCAMGEDNPIVSIHDVGAGGVCNALPELVHDSGQGGAFELRNILNDEPGMSPMQIWCNESQERYVLAVNPAQFELFESICKRERCLYAHVGNATDEQKLTLTDQHFDSNSSSTSQPIDLPMDVLFGLPPKMHRDVVSYRSPLSPFCVNDLSLEEAAHRVLRFPTVADKTFLVTIGDRSVSGLITRDQMVGPWQVPVADVGVTSSGYTGYTGEAMAVGERTPIAAIDAVASGRMAIGEALTNLAAASIDTIEKIKLSANWMVAAGEPGQDADLYETVKSITQDLCPTLGISIPVGKDSMSMKSVWQSEGVEHKAVSPMSLVVTAFAAVSDVRQTLTPQLKLDQGDSDLWLIDLGNGKNRMGGSILAQVTNQLGDSAPNVDDAEVLRNFFEFIQKLKQQGLLMAYHDRSDGGLFGTLCEMAFAARCGLSIDLDELSFDSNRDHQLAALEVLFNEELGAVIQAKVEDAQAIKDWADSFGVSGICHRIGTAEQGDHIQIQFNGISLFDQTRSQCHRTWSQVSWRMQTIRDNPICAQEEYDRLLDENDTGLFSHLTFDPNDIAAPAVQIARPKIAILREQGVNGQLEMAAAFDRVGFETVDVTMSDLVDGADLKAYKGLAACGGFSFGDVLGAGKGWGKSILFNDQLRDTFSGFFQRSDTFALGVCNGCQMMASIKTLIPGAQNWPEPKRNFSEQYEARFVMVEVCESKSILFEGMQGAMFPVSVAHGEGQMAFENESAQLQAHKQAQVSLRFVDNLGNRTQRYPYNPNGSQDGLTGITNDDGRFTIMMPHPERVFRTVSNSWHPDNWGELSPWAKLFQNARHWVN